MTKQVWAKQVWASGDRHTIWTRKLTKTHPDGTVEVWTVEKVGVLHPSTQQVAKVRSGQIVLMRILPATRQLYFSSAGTPMKHTHYYSFLQSFHGGPSARGDLLSGVTTGQVGEVFEDTYRHNMHLLKKRGFTVYAET